MADPELPSFSLGLDTPPHSPINPPHVSDSDSDPDTGPAPPRSIFKRLRRGPPLSSQKPSDTTPCFDLDLDDDIEEFSSQDDLDQACAPSSALNRSVCSSSKVSLNGCGVLTHQSCSNSREGKTKQTFDVPVSARLETGKSGLVFPKLKASPLRRFQLLDSDSDDSIGDDVDVSGVDKVEPSSKEATYNRGNPLSSVKNGREMSFDMECDRDLWKDFSPVKNVSVPTPAFDELCEEYFSSAKCKVGGKSGVDMFESCNERYPGISLSCQRDEQQSWESSNPLPPAHHYFFHEDPRVRQLVRSRLCHFSPLGVNRVNQQHNVSHIDYMGQFGNGGASKTQGVQNGYVNNSTRGRNNLVAEETFNASGGGWVDPRNFSSTFSHGESSRKKATKRNSTKNSVSKSKNKTNKSNSSSVPLASTNWVEPKSCTSTPKDAGKRRVQASGQSAGHWYTSSDGRKVYVNKSGQELTGRGAYRQYRKESGAGFRKSKKKTDPKKTNAKKRN
ncbi:hypothetical protein RJT34_10915 [Clitoria ternatea]|uniref:Uncharacterized protein n=1 Tax=Clitoria ternatea TaxID=43366 RepID=A0AAN9JJI5_CLITE